MNTTKRPRVKKGDWVIDEQGNIAQAVDSETATTWAMARNAQGNEIVADEKCRVVSAAEVQIKQLLRGKE